MNKLKFLLMGIFLLGAILRFYQLGKTPVGLEWDEVALGYDAYSILKTGKDQFGNFIPLTFRSLDDYKPPLYIYSAVPGIALFGMNEFTARLPAAVYGSFGVIFTYFLVTEIFIRERRSKRNKIALLSSLFLAISPWSLQFSRAAFETNLAVTVIITAVWLFLRAQRLRSVKTFIFSAFFFGLALFSYHSARVLTPMLLLFLFFIFRRRIDFKKFAIPFVLVYGIFFLFFIPIVKSPDAQIRFRVTNALQVDQNEAKSAQRILDDTKIGAVEGAKIFFNRRLAIFNYENFLTVIHNYIVHFDPEFLFVKGDAPLHHAPDFGMLYFFDLFFIIVGGVIYIVKHRTRQSLILPVWLLLAPISAAVTTQVPHSVRTEVILPTFHIFSALGLVFIYDTFKKESVILSFFAVLFFLPVFYFSVGKYLYHYYFYTNNWVSDKWLYGRKEAVAYTESVKDQYDKVIVSLSVDMPLNFWLFYSNYDPVTYLAGGGTRSNGFLYEGNAYDKYEFRNFSYQEMKYFPGRILLVGTSKNFPSDIATVKTTYYMDGQTALKIVEAGTGKSY